MTELQQNRYDQLLRRVGSLKGPGSMVNDALTELFPMIDMENVPTELLLLGGSRICVGRGFSNNLAANFSQVMLRMSGGASSIATILEVVAFSDVAQAIALGPTQNTYTLNGVEAFSDGRVFGEGTVARVLFDRLLAVGSNFMHHQVNGVDATVFSPSRGFATITPGNAFSVSNTVVNTDLEVSFLWIERVAEPSELNL